MNLSAVIAKNASDSDPVLLRGDILQSAKKLKKCGYNGMEIHLKSPDEIDIDALFSFCNEQKMSVSAFATGMIKRIDGLTFIDDSEYIRRRAVQRVEEFIALAAVFNAAIIIGSLRGTIADKSTAKYYDRFYKCMESILKKAQEYNVTILLEVINRYENNYLNTALETIDFIKPIDCANLKINLDTFHMNIEETDMSKAIILCGKKLGHVHLADNTRRYLGSGTIDFKKIFNACRHIGYKGFFSLECQPEIDDEKALKYTIKNINALLDMGKML